MVVFAAWYEPEGILQLSHAASGFSLMMKINVDIDEESPGVLYEKYKEKFAPIGTFLRQIDDPSKHIDFVFDQMWFSEAIYAAIVMELMAIREKAKDFSEEAFAKTFDFRDLQTMGFCVGKDVDDLYDQLELSRKHRPGFGDSNTPLDYIRPVWDYLTTEYFTHIVDDGDPDGKPDIPESGILINTTELKKQVEKLRGGR